MYNLHTSNGYSHNIKRNNQHGDNVWPTCRQRDADREATWSQPAAVTVISSSRNVPMLIPTQWPLTVRSASQSHVQNVLLTSTSAHTNVCSCDTGTDIAATTGGRAMNDASRYTNNEWQYVRRQSRAIAHDWFMTSLNHVQLHMIDLWHDFNHVQLHMIEFMS